MERFRTAIASAMGLEFDEAKLPLLAEVLRGRLDATRLSADAYVARLVGPANRADVRALATHVTVGETYFFRHIEQLRAFAEVVLPARTAARGADKRLRVLSAGCASGEEVYSLAIITLETLPDRSWDVSIRGVDINPASLDKARRGRYSPWALRGLAEDVKARWLDQVGKEFVVKAPLRERVEFGEANLAEDDPQLWREGTYDAIFCRNVLMYFSAMQMQAVIDRMSRALVPGGYLFLGHAETLRGISGDFHLRHTHDAFYYQRKEATAGGAPARSASLPPPAPGVAAAVDSADSWIAAILAGAAHAPVEQAPAQHAPADVPSRRAWDLGVALELLRKEQFAEALSIIESLPPESGNDADVLLLHAVLLTLRGELARAEAACRRLLGVDEFSAGAHYLLALCREGAGDRERATHHDQVAIYLDPAFAMPRLHLGLLARRTGDRMTARRELEQALVLLQREDASRVLLFGGGFTREALVTLCRAELAAVGGTT